MVSKINLDARSVTVEWYERNETKGKEIELDTILQLNAELAQQEELAASMPKIIKQTSTNALTRVSKNRCSCIFTAEKIDLHELVTREIASELCKTFNRSPQPWRSNVAK